MERSDNAMIALRHKNRTFLRNGAAIGALMLASGLTTWSAQAQTYQPSVEVDLSVLDSLGPAPTTPSVDLNGSTTNQLDLYGTTQAPAAAISEESVLLLPVPESTDTGSDSVLLLNQPATTATDDFEFPSAAESMPEPEPAMTVSTTTVVEPEAAQAVAATTIVEPEPIALPEAEAMVDPDGALDPVAIVVPAPEPEPEVMVEVEPEVMSEPESDMLIAAPQTEAEVAAASASALDTAADDDAFAEIDDLLSEANEPQDINVPEPAMTMDGTDVAVVSTGDSDLAGEDIRILFQPDDDALTAEDESVLRGLAGRLDAEPDRRIQLRAYASSEGTSASDARRLALSRALAVRAFLIENNVRSTRIDVRALGDKAESGPLDRIDIVLVER
jgi:outer membrane protein OmpA-like peptidoglycan-associated protein